VKNAERKIELHDVAIDHLYEAVYELIERVNRLESEVKKIHDALIQLCDVVRTLHRGELTVEDVLNMFPRSILK